MIPLENSLIAILDIDAYVEMHNITILDSNIAAVDDSDS